MFFDSDIIDSVLNSRVVMMCGVSGSGKTYYSRHLENHGFTRISLDEIIWNCYGTLNKDISINERKMIFDEAFRTLVGMLESNLKAGDKTVVDSTMCKRCKRHELRDICIKYGIDPLIVYLDVQRPLLEKRLSERSGSGPNDLIVSREELVRFCSGFEIPVSDENFVKITM